jgi:hypothetical protein
MSACTTRLGIWAAILSVVFAGYFSIVALAANFKAAADPIHCHVAGSTDV